MENTNTINKKISEVCKNQPYIGKDGLNPHFKSSYATFNSIMASIKPLLEKENLAISFFCDGEFYNMEVLDLSNNEKKTSKIRINENLDAQKLGSFFTYMRRYLITSMFNLLIDYDDDGEQSVGREKKTIVKNTEVVPEALEVQVKSAVSAIKQVKTKDELAKLQLRMTAWISKLDEDKKREIYEHLDLKKEEFN